MRESLQRSKGYRCWLNFTFLGDTMSQKSFITQVAIFVPQALTLDSVNRHHRGSFYQSRPLGIATAGPTGFTSTANN